MAILQFRCRAKNILHRIAYCTSCQGMISYQSVPYGTEWSELQKLNWAQDCDEHRSLCDAWIEEHHAKMTGMHAKQGLLSPEGNGAAGTAPAPETAAKGQETGLCGCGRDAVVITAVDLERGKPRLYCTACKRWAN